MQCGLCEEEFEDEESCDRHLTECHEPNIVAQIREYRNYNIKYYIDKHPQWGV